MRRDDWFFDAILWLARSGARRRDLPEDRFGPCQTTKRRYHRWIEAGVSDRIFEGVADDGDLRSRLREIAAGRRRI